MKIRFPLYLQTISMLLFYLASLLLLVALCFNAEFGVGWDALIRSPVGDRIDTIADAIVSRLSTAPTKNWNQILANFDSIYHIQFSLFDIFDRQIGGQHISLPSALTRRMAPPHAHIGFEGKPMFLTFNSRFKSLHRFDDALMRTMPPVSGVQPFRPPPSLGQNAEFEPPPPDSKEPTGANPASHLPSEFHPTEFGPPDLPPPPTIFMHAHDRFIVHTNEPNRFWIGTRVMLNAPDFDHPIPATILASCGNIWQTTLLFDWQFAGLVFATILIISILFWSPFIFRITHALSDLTQATERIAEGRFDTRLKTKRSDELGRLAEAVNIMAERLSNFVSGQKRFLGDISHELFSPLARLNVALELLKNSATEEQKSLIVDIEEEAVEMNNLINELLAFSKAGFKNRQPELIKIHLQTLIEKVVSQFDREKEQAITIAIPNGLNVLSDPMLLERSLSNVIRNSIRYAGHAGPIEIRAAQKGSEISLTIADNGPGVPEDALKNLAEPFFRPEPSRDRSSGGAGLGLAIVKTCIEACGGSIVLSNRQPHGFVVEIRLQTA